MHAARRRIHVHRLHVGTPVAAIGSAVTLENGLHDRSPRATLLDATTITVQANGTANFVPAAVLAGEGGRRRAAG